MAAVQPGLPKAVAIPRGSTQAQETSVQELLWVTSPPGASVSPPAKGGGDTAFFCQVLGKLWVNTWVNGWVYVTFILHFCF